MTSTEWNILNADTYQKVTAAQRQTFVASNGRRNHIMTHLPHKLRNKVGFTSWSRINTLRTDHYLIFKISYQLYDKIWQITQISPLSKGEIVLSSASCLWTISQLSIKKHSSKIFKLLPMRYIFFDLVIRFTTNRKYAFFCIF